jgi:UDP-N-acetylmuramoyl-tripeptide--D-alanyl-D-alanine ligase
MISNLKENFRRARAALVRRSRSETCFIAVTGSSGKTTATELIGSVLAEAFPTRYFSGYNALKHVAENMISIDKRTRFSVQEVHGGAPGSARDAAQIIRPNVAVVTVVGLEHRDSLASPEEVAAAKSDLLAALSEDGLAILNADDPLVFAMAGRTTARVATFGTRPDADLRCVGARMQFPAGLRLDVEFADKSFTIESRLIGKHWMPAILAAILTGLELGVAPEHCIRAIGAYEPHDGRCSLHPFIHGAMIVNDAYKAPEWSLDAFFDLIASVEAPRKTVVFGELTDSKQKKGRLLRRIERQAALLCDRVVFVGAPATRSLSDRSDSSGSGKLTILADVRSAYEFLANSSIDGEVIFLKSSRSMHLDRIVRNHESPIACWRELCGRKIQCTECEQLRVR